MYSMYYTLKAILILDPTVQTLIQLMNSIGTFRLPYSQFKEKLF